MTTKKIKKDTKEKKKKLSRIPTINRRLFALWSEAVRSRAEHSCEYCGVKKGTITKSGKPTKIDAHHLINRDIKDCPLKFDIRNGIALCPSCHKFSPSNAFHSNPITTITWLMENSPERYQFVLNNYKQTVDLQNRDILAKIEESLRNKESLDICALKEIQTQAELIAQQEKEAKASFAGNIFESTPADPEQPKDPQDPPA